jgi:phenylacetate-CoA ligase
MKNHRIPCYQPKGIITSAEVLRDEDRVLIEEVFGAPIFNRYGTREVSVIASECDAHDGMHIMAEGIYVEIVKNGKHCAPGEIGEVVITDILNDAMPLIRYRLMDTTKWLARTCRCGRHLPRISNVAGRVNDFLVDMKGQLVVGPALALPIVGQRPSFRQVQIVQEELGKILFRVACGKDKTLSQDDRDFVLREVAAYLGEGMKVDFEYVDSIPHEASGKYLLSKSSIAKDIFSNL